MAKAKRFLSLVLAMALLLGNAVPAGTAGGVWVTSAQAAEVQEVTATVSAQNGTVTDISGNALADSFPMAIGELFQFKVLPEDGYKVSSVTANSDNLTADADGIYSVIPTEDISIEVVCVQKEAPVFQAAAIPEGPAQVKRIQVSIIGKDAEISLQAYSTEEYVTAEALDAAMQTGTAAELTDGTQFTTEGTYYVYLLDAEGRLSSRKVEITGIDTVAPAAASVIRNGAGWQSSAAYTVVLPEGEEIGKVTYTAPGGAKTEIKASEEGTYLFTVSGNGSYTVTVYDKAGNGTSCTVVEDQIDTTAPTVVASRITSGWATSAQYTLTFSDEGCGIYNMLITADGITITNYYDPAETYTMTLSYNQTAQIKVTDKLGNTHTYEVQEDQIDNNPPVIGVPERQESSWSNTANYRFQVTDSESGIKAVTVTIGTAAAQTLTADEDGYYSFTVDEMVDCIIRAEDNLGNVNTYTVTESQIDQTPPVISEPVRENDSWSQSATYTFTTEDALAEIAAVSVTFGGEQIPVTENEDGSFSFTVSENGEYTITVRESAGNSASRTVTEARIDTTEPVVTATRTASGWGTSASYTYTASDADSGVEYLIVTIGGNSTTIVFDADDTYVINLSKNQTVEIKAVDFAGNEHTHQITESNIDTTAPEITAPVRQESGWVTSATYTFQVTDAASGVDAVTLTVGSGTPEILTPDANGQYSFTLNANATYTISATDKVGNLNTVSGEDTQIDTVNPVISTPARKDAGWQQNTEYQFQVTDDLSGVASVSVTLNGQEIPPTETDNTVSFPVVVNGSYIITVTDGAGNTATATVEETQIDTVVPEITAARSQNGWATASTWTVTITDGASGIVKVTMTNASGEEEEIAVTASGSYTVDFAENRVCKITATDDAGNEFTYTITEDKIDTEAPVISDFARTQSGWATSSDYTFRVTDPASGIAKVLLKMAGKETVLTANAEGVYSFHMAANGDYEIQVTDNLGNTDSKSGTEANIDLAKPYMVGGFVRDPGGWKASAVYSFHVADDDSGIASVTAVGPDGAAVTVTDEGSGAYSFTSTENGSYTVTIRDNVGYEYIISVFDGYIDYTAPSISDPVRSVDGWKSAASYTFTVTDPASGVASVTATYNGTERKLTATNGKYQIDLGYNQTITIKATDVAGNEQILTIEENHIDPNTPRIVAVTRLQTGWQQSADYAIEAADDLSGIMTVTVAIGNGTPQTLTVSGDGRYIFRMEENAAYTITVTDRAGNITTQSGTETQIDITAPESVTITRDEEGWEYDTTYTVSVADTQSGVASVTYRLGNGEDKAAAGSNGTYTFPAAENGTYTVTITDNVGNVTVKTVTEDRIDYTAPIAATPIRQEADWTQQATYTFTVEDPASGIAAVTAKANGGTTILTPNASGIYTLILSKNQTAQIDVTDTVGNVTTITITEEKVDTTMPEVLDLKRSQTGWQQAADYTFTVSDDMAGVVSVTVSIAGGEAQSLQPDATGSYTFHMAANGSFEIAVTDKAGNVRMVSGEETQTDTTAPVIQAIERVTESWSYTSVYKVTAEDVLAGIASVTFRYGNGEESTLVADSNGDYSFVADANGTYTVTVTDRSGNSVSKSVNEALLDQTPPEVTGILRDPNTWSQDAVFTLSVEDPASGVASVEAFLDETKIPVTEVGTGKYSFPSEANGSYSITVTDVVGNAKTIRVREGLIDQLAPVIAKIQPQEDWDAETNTVIIRAYDESELARVEIRDAEGKQYAVSAEGGILFSAVVDHNGEYTATAIDTAGNSVSVKFTVWHIDTESPEVPVLESSGEEQWVNTDVTITAVTTDSQSGVQSYWYSDKKVTFDPETWTQMDMSGGVASAKFTAEQDTVYYVVAVDNVGRISEPAAVRVAIDTTPASGHVLTYLQTEDSGYRRTVDGIRIYNDKIRFSLSAQDSASGVAGYEFQVVTAEGKLPWVYRDGDESGVVQTILLQDTTAYIQFRVYDEAGNCSDVVTIQQGETPETVIIENTPAEDADRAPAPKADLTIGEAAYKGAWTSQDVTVTVSGSDAISGIEYYEWMMIPADPAKQATQWQKIPIQDGVGTITVTGDTNGKFLFRAVTFAGNYSQSTAAQIRIQKSLPQIAQVVPEAATGTNGWYTQHPGYEIILPEVDPHAAPVRYEISYTFNEVEQEKISYDLSNAPQIDADGIWTVLVTTIDAAGNRNAAAKATTFRVDTQVPDDLHVLLNGTEEILAVRRSGTAGFSKVNTYDCVLATDFTVFRNETVTVQPTADGGDSGLAALYYQTGTTPDSYDPAGKWTPVSVDGIQLKPDQKYCLFFKAVDTAGNITYFSAKSILLDTKAPGGANGSNAITLQPTDKNRSAHGFYSGDVTVNVHIEEPVLDTVFSGLQSISYRVLADGRMTQQGTIRPSEESLVLQEGRTLSWTGSITISGILNNSNNVVLEVTAVDAAGNVRTTSTAYGEIRIDMTDPVIDAAYDHNEPAAHLNGSAYFTGSRKLTVTVTERNFVAAESRVYVTDQDTGKTVAYEWSSEGNNHTAVLDIQEDGHYTVHVSITDAAGNNSTTMVFAEGSVAANAFVIDNTSPIVTISYDNNDALGYFFDAPRTARITVIDRNFDPANFTAAITCTAENGTVHAVPLSSWVSNGNSHTASVLFSGNGEYSVEVSCTDIPGNESGNVRYTGIAAQKFVIDLDISKPQFSSVLANDAYAGELIPVITFLDHNLADYTLTLYRTRLNEIHKDVTEEVLTGHVTEETVAGGMKVSLDIFPEEEAYDGIYTLEAAITDKAGNTESSSITFSVNRFGSTYVYDEDLLAVNGQILYKLDKDLIITEINPTRLEAGSLMIQITKDGTPIANPIYREIPAADGTEQPAESGWYEYQYVITKENFTQDGTYTVVISTKDSAGNVPENTSGSYAIRFSIDTTAPELSSVVGLEEAIVKADSLSVRFDAIDNIGLSRITVYVDGEEVSRWTELEGYSHSGTFTIAAGLDRHVRIVLEDKAGNILDTDAEGFAPGYAWQDVTVSTNGLLRFYANKPLFYGTLAALGLGIGWIFFLIWKRKKKEAK